MKNRSPLLTLTVLSIAIFLQSCSFAKKAQCTKIVDHVNQINALWKKSDQIKPLDNNQKPKNMQEVNSVILGITQPITGVITEVDPLLDQLEGEKIDDKLLAVYRQNLLFLHIKRSNLLREGINSLRKFSTADIPEMKLRSGGSMSESLLEPKKKEENKLSVFPKNDVDLGEAVNASFGRPDPVKARQKMAARMAEMQKSIQFLQNMGNLDEEIKPEELRIMRRVSAACDIPMPKAN